jgi:beta-glucosidase
MNGSWPGIDHTPIPAGGASTICGAVFLVVCNEILSLQDLSPLRPRCWRAKRLGVRNEVPLLTGSGAWRKPAGCSCAGHSGAPAPRSKTLREQDSPPKLRQVLERGRGGAAFADGTSACQKRIDRAVRRRHPLRVKFSVKYIAFVAAASLPPFFAAAQNTPPAAATEAPTNAVAVHTNNAVIPVPRTGASANRQNLVLQRAKSAPGDYDIEFIGDSITQGWEGAGTNVWREFYGGRKAINLGVGGDRTQHVLWRFENGQLDGIKAKAAVVMIGTNNSKDDSEADILEGVAAIVRQIRVRQPGTKIILLGIFPRGQTFSEQRGKILEVNQALAKMDDGKNIFYIDFGSQLIESDGSISQSMMPDYLHPGEAGYKIWANAIEPKLRQILAN